MNEPHDISGQKDQHAIISHTTMRQNICNGLDKQDTPSYRAVTTSHVLRPIADVPSATVL